ncbi:TadE/TadG family type IV pilus assembly protein [Defluviimonas sp. SAOS-178_SWC]|uniref:TadE/TadG family type IV pilus assembly protein n=1 Tax=Defluviimonas sp. SAOS-178_SWC TaxID=3121287 RepID=UPI00322191F8
MTSPITPLLRFAREERGAALVEFALVLPMMLLVFAMIVESARIMIGFQSAIGGVRDATRYLARVVPMNICATGSTTSAIAPYTNLVPALKNKDLGAFFLPGAITVTDVRVVLPSIHCNNSGYRASPVAVVTVEADVEIQMPFSNIFALVGGAAIATFTTTISDSARVYGS